MGNVLCSTLQHRSLPLSYVQRYNTVVVFAIILRSTVKCQTSLHHVEAGHYTKEEDQPDDGCLKSRVVLLQAEPGIEEQGQTNSHHKAQAVFQHLILVVT